MLKNRRNLHTHTHTHTHTHGCLCKIIPIIATFAIINPSYSNIDKDASAATCDSNTIGTTTGPANLQAAWTANTINLEWYSNNTELEVGTSSATCTYDGGITLPSTPTVPTGYTFGGWKVRVAAAPSAFDLSTLAQYINTNGDARYGHGWYDNADYCYAYGTGTVDGNGASVCTQDSGMSDVALNQWKTVFSYGTVRGEAVCANNAGVRGEAGTPQGTGQYCWCRATGFDAEKDGTYQNVASSSWVFRTSIVGAGNCTRSCAYGCADDVRGFGGTGFRRALFGVTQ